MDRAFERDLLVPRSGDKKQTCPACGPTRHNPRDQSMSVNADGRFYCHNCFAAGKVGATADPNRYGTMPRYTPPKTYTSPPPIVAAAQQDKLGVFFGTRGITEAVVARNGITLGEDGGIKFPYYRAGELVNVKTRYPGKKFSMSAGAELIFWGIDDCRDAGQVVVVEGEMDKLALEVAGITAVLSVPNGAQTGTMDFLASGEAIFATCHTVVLAVDNDAPGQALEEELARRIGKDICYRVRWPEDCKDANDVLIRHGADRLRTCVAEATGYPIEGIAFLDDIAGELDDLYDQGFDQGVGIGCPRFDQHYRVRPGLLTIVTGIPSHGKSTFLDWFLVELIARHGWAIGICSPENQPIKRHAAGLLAKFVGKPFHDGLMPRMSKSEMQEARDRMREHIAFVLPEEPTLDAILDGAKSLVFRMGIKGLVIDPWNEIEHARPSRMSETEYTSECLGSIRRFARAHDVHVWLVAHPTKLRRNDDGSEPVAALYDISGSANFRNKADAGLTVWRDLTNPLEPTQVHVTKIRFAETGQLGVVEFAHARETGRFREVPA